MRQYLRHLCMQYEQASCEKNIPLGSLDVHGFADASRGITDPHEIDRLYEDEEI